MIIVRQQQQQQQPMLVVSSATNNVTHQQQQMQLLQQQQTSIRLGRAGAGTQSPRQPSPVGAAGHFMSPRAGLHTTLSGTVLSQPAPNHPPAPEQPPGGYPPPPGLNLDLSGLPGAGTSLGRADGDVTPLTPQDQLSRYVEQL